MQHRTIFAFLLVLLACGTSCEAQPKPAIPLVVEGGPTWNFGQVTHKEKREHTFVLRNISNDTVRITSVKPACGCTAVMVSGSTLAPDGTALVSVNFVAPRTSNGKQNKSVSVYIQGMPGPVAVLRVEADVLSAFHTPTEPLDLGALRVNKPVDATVLLENRSAEEQTIDYTQSALAVEYRGLDGNAPPEVRPLDEVEFEPKKFTLAAGERREVRVRFTPRIAGKLMGAVVFYALDETRQVEFAGSIAPR